MTDNPLRDLRDTRLLRVQELVQRDVLGFWKSPTILASAHDTTILGWMEAANDTCRNRGLRPDHVFLLSRDHPASTGLPADAVAVNVDASAVIVKGPIPSGSVDEPPERDANFWGHYFPLIHQLTGAEPSAYGYHKEIPVAYRQLSDGRHLVCAGTKPVP